MKNVPPLFPTPTPSPFLSVPSSGKRFLPRSQPAPPLRTSRALGRLVTIGSVRLRPRLRGGCRGRGVGGWRRPGGEGSARRACHAEEFWGRGEGTWSQDSSSWARGGRRASQATPPWPSDARWQLGASPELVE